MAGEIKILFLVSNSHLTDQRMQRICSSLSKNGFKCELVGIKSRFAAPGYTYKVIGLRTFFVKGILFYFELMIRQILFGLKNNFDLVSSVDSDTALAAKFLSKLKKKIHVHDFHEWFTEVPELHGKPVKKCIWKTVEKLSLNGVASYTVSPGLAEYYKDHLSAHVSLIPNYPVTKLITSVLKKYDVIYQGAINKGRCLKALVDSCKKNKWRLCICGTGDLDEDLQTWIGESEYINWKGTVLPEELHHFTQEAILGFNVLDNNSKSYDESMPNKTFDYIMAGIPQVISDSKQLLRLNSEFNFAYSVNKTDEQSISEVISMALKQDSEYQLKEKNCLALRKEWNWEMIEPQLISFYQQHAK